MSIILCSYSPQFIALYDYDPVKSSPCEHPEFELSFCEGDLIKVYGREMEDGFMSGEVRERNIQDTICTCVYICNPQLVSSMCIDQFMTIST